MVRHVHRISQISQVILIFSLFLPNKSLKEISFVAHVELLILVQNLILEAICIDLIKLALANERLAFAFIEIRRVLVREVFRLLIEGVCGWFLYLSELPAATNITFL
jgi:hypothetical protein